MNKLKQATVSEINNKIIAKQKDEDTYIIKKLLSLDYDNQLQDLNNKVEFTSNIVKTGRKVGIKELLSL